MRRWLLVLWRRWRVRRDLYENKPERHPALSQVTIGEIVPFKGVNWRVADVREQPIPAVIFVPLGETRASKVQHLRELRRRDKILSTLERETRLAAQKQAVRVGRRG